MWAYYANADQGVVIEFLFDTDNGEGNHLVKVRYRGLEHEQNSLERGGCVYKKEDWELEKEYRIVKKAQESEAGEPGSYCSVEVQSVIFGRRTSRKEQELITRMAMLSSPSLRTYTKDEFANELVSRQLLPSGTSGNRDWRTQIVENGRLWLREHRRAVGVSHDGKEWWKILDLRFDSSSERGETVTKALLVSELVFGPRPYNSKVKETTWGDCSLRHWLNGPFYKGLPKTARARVVEVSNYYLYDNGVPNDAEEAEFVAWDKVFLLSAMEAAVLFSNDRDRLVLIHNGDWWLRSPGVGDMFAALVHWSGEINNEMYWADDGKVVELHVRPALWLNMTNRDFIPAENRFDYAAYIKAEDAKSNDLKALVEEIENLENELKLYLSFLNRSVPVTLWKKPEFNKLRLPRSKRMSASLPAIVEELELARRELRAQDPANPLADDRRTDQIKQGESVGSSDFNRDTAHGVVSELE
jgi:hypothetical protein